MIRTTNWNRIYTVGAAGVGRVLQGSERARAIAAVIEGLEIIAVTDEDEGKCTAAADALVKIKTALEK